LNAFIFARGGSKGVPGKNCKNFAGKPLIAWTIEFALSIGCFNKVIVSTDSEEIARISRFYGASVPFIRPSFLAEDNSPEWLAWRHAINPVTAPLRSQSDIVNCIEDFRHGGVDGVITITEAKRHPSFNMVKQNPAGFIELLSPDSESGHQRQAFSKVFDIATVCYVFNPNFVLSQDSLFRGKLRGVLVPSERAIDIDTLQDFDYAEYLFRRAKGK
jgi:CMP-N-acetylneuraminic acid synthetase